MKSTSVNKMNQVYAHDIYPAIGLKYCHLGYWHDDKSDDFGQAQEALIEEVAAPLGLTAAHRILDVGGGNGDTALWLHRTYGCQIVVVDIVDALILDAQQKIEAAGFQGAIEAICGDILAMRFPAQHFDHILSIGAIHHIPDHTTLMKQLFGWLKPGGKMSLHTYDCLLKVPLLRPFYLELSVANRDLPAIASYPVSLGEAGFVGIVHTDLTTHILEPSTRRLWSEPYYSRMLAWHCEHYGWLVMKLFASLFSRLHLYIVNRSLLRIHLIYAEK